MLAVPKELRDIRVLCVDRQPASLALLCATLRSHGAAATRAPSVAVARALLQEMAFDVVLSNFAGSGYDDSDLAQALRSVGDGDRRPPPVIALSSFEAAQLVDVVRRSTAADEVVAASAPV